MANETLRQIAKEAGVTLREIGEHWPGPATSFDHKLRKPMTEAEENITLDIIDSIKREAK